MQENSQGTSKKKKKRKFIKFIVTDVIKSRLLKVLCREGTARAM